MRQFEDLPILNSVDGEPEFLVRQELTTKRWGYRSLADYLITKLFHEFLTPILNRLDALEAKVFPIVNADNVTNWIVSDLWRVNGSAVLMGEYLLLTPDVWGQAGTWFLMQPKLLTASTEFHIHAKLKSSLRVDGADGFSVILHNGSIGASYLGGASSSVGAWIDSAASLPTHTPIFYLKISSWDTPHIELAKITETTSEWTDVGLSFNINSVPHFNVWMDYSNGILAVYVSASDVKPQIAVTNYAINFHSFLGNRFFVGLGAGTGGRTNQHQALSFSFTS